MHFPFERLRLSIAVLTFLTALAVLLALDHSDLVAQPEDSEVSGVQLGLTAEAREALQESDLAFPSDDAGFSAYYRMGSVGNYSLNKGTVDDHIFGPVDSNAITLRTAPATLVEIGDNYTVSTLPLKNIDSIVSTVNLYYDDEGWIAAYLPSGTPSSQIWQSREENPENPEITDISNTTLLDTINVVVEDALGETEIAHDDSSLGYYHWQHTDAENFLMMAVSRQIQGEYPVQFSVPTTLTVAEVSATMWVSQSTNADPPCAKVTLDDTDLIAEQCTKGISSSSANLSDFNAQTNHTWKLIQSQRDEGASGALLMILYSVSN